MKLGQSLREKSWYSSVGISEEGGHAVLIVYLRKPPGQDGDSIPKQWDGLPVRSKRIGKLRPA